MKMIVSRAYTYLTVNDYFTDFEHFAMYYTFAIVWLNQVGYLGGLN